MKNNIIVGVGAVVVIDKKILLVKRGHKPCAGYWSIPGGHVEYGEKLVDAVKRELLEETGVEAEPLGVIWVSEILPYMYPDTMKHYILIDFLMKPKTKPLSNIRASSDAIDAGLFEINNPPEKLTPSARRLISYLARLIDKGEELLYQRVIPLDNIGLGEVFG